MPYEDVSDADLLHWLDRIRGSVYGQHVRRKIQQELERRGVSTESPRRRPKNVGGSTWNQLVTLISWHGAVCWICGLQEPGWPGNPNPQNGAYSSCTRDHVVPKSKGGSNELSNLRPAHRYCNGYRGDRDLTDGIRAATRSYILAERRDRAAKRQRRKARE